MKMIVHQAKGMHLPFGFQTRLSMRLYEPPMIFIVFENRFPPVSPVHQVVDRSWIFNPQRLWHAID